MLFFKGEIHEVETVRVLEGELRTVQRIADGGKRNGAADGKHLNEHAIGVGRKQARIAKDGDGGVGGDLRQRHFHGEQGEAFDRRIIADGGDHPVEDVLGSYGREVANVSVGDKAGRDVGVGEFKTIALDQFQRPRIACAHRDRAEVLRQCAGGDVPNLLPSALRLRRAEHEKVGGNYWLNFEREVLNIRDGVAKRVRHDKSGLDVRSPPAQGDAAAVDEREEVVAESELGIGQSERAK